MDYQRSEYDQWRRLAVDRYDRRLGRYYWNRIGNPTYYTSRRAYRASVLARRIRLLNYVNYRRPEE